MTDLCRSRKKNETNLSTWKVCTTLKTRLSRGTCSRFTYISPQNASRPKQSPARRERLASPERTATLAVSRTGGDFVDLSTTRRVEDDRQRLWRLPCQPSRMPATCLVLVAAGQTPFSEDGVFALVSTNNNPDWFRLHSV